MSDRSYTLEGTHHVELFVGNARQAAFYYQKAWGFRIVAYSGLETGVRDRVSYVLQQDRIRIMLTSPLGPGGEVNAFLDRHGDGVRDLALMCTDAAAAFEATTAGGAEAVREPRVLEDEHGTVVLATVRAYHDVLHTFVQHQGYGGVFLPGFQAPPVGVVNSEPVGLRYIDHMVNNMPEGGMEPQEEFYKKAFGFHRFWSVDDKDIHTEFSALNSVVVSSPSGRVRMPINEPAPGVRKSQIQEFVDYNIDPGVQHVAFLTHDIVATIAKLRANGVEFLAVPDAYYETLTERVGEIDEDLEVLRRHRILVDRDEDTGGYLLQLFSRPVQDRPTLFFEVIQRKGSESFGKGNFKALFEAIEREQALRGNL